MEKLGDTLLTRVRIAYANAKERTGRKLYIELRERKKNNSPLAELNAGDSRFSSSSTVPAWIIAEPEQFYKLFNIPKEMQDRLNRLAYSTGIPVKDQLENMHFINLNIPNPTVNGERLRVQINESIQKSSDRDKPKINPSTGEILKYNGQNIYRSTSIVFGEPKDVTIVHNETAKPSNMQSVPTPEIATAAMVAGS
jgi:hypothetical protein